MVDWEFVDRRRAAGKGWEEIADDRRAGFDPDPNGPSAGRQLRALARERAREPTPTDALSEEKEARRWSLARIGWLVFPFLAPWAFLAIFLPSPVGVYVPGIPLLGLLTAAAAVLLGIGLLRVRRKWTPVYRQTATIGVTAGLIVAGLLGGAALAAGCPVLSPFTTPEPGGWERVSHASWTVEGVPVLFFYGSVACPYCSASSWAILAALQRLGNVTGVTYDHSSPTDVYPNTPSVVLPDLTVDSAYVSLDARESTGDTQITAASTGSCVEQAYLSAYNPLGAIPFVVLGGTFVHASATLVDPAALQGLSATQIHTQLNASSGPAYDAISPAQNDLLAFSVYLNHGAPSSVANDPGVASVVSQIR